MRELVVAMGREGMIILITTASAYFDYSYGSFLSSRNSALHACSNSVRAMTLSSSYKEWNWSSENQASFSKAIKLVRSRASVWPWGGCL